MPAQVIERRVYDLSGFLVRLERAGIVSEWARDGLGRPVGETLPTGAVIRRGFDDEGRVVWQAAWAPGNVPTTKPTAIVPGLMSMVEVEYDAVGRQIRETQWKLEGG